MRRFFETLIFVLALGILLCSACGPNSDGSKLMELEQLDRSLPVFPLWVQTSEHRISKGTLASVSRYYKSEAAYDDVRSFYVAELKQRGWEYAGERGIKDWGTDLGGRELIFRSGEYQFSVTYAGEKAAYGWHYATGIDWGK
jgi:hypothetical protein